MITDFDDLLEENPITTKNQAVSLKVIGSAVTVSDLKARISAHNYDQLTDGDDDNGTLAIGAAETHAGTIMAKFGRSLDRDDPVDREIVVVFAICELYLRLGQAEAGREYRIKAKDLIAAAYGEYPESGKAETAKVAAGSVYRAERKSYP